MFSSANLMKTLTSSFLFSTCPKPGYALQVVHEEFGIVEGLMTTVHATTGFSFSLYLTCA